MNFKKKFLGVVVLSLIGLCSPQIVISQNNYHTTGYTQRISLGINYTSIPKWGIQTFRSVELVYGKELKARSFIVLGSFSVISYCNCFEKGIPSVPPSTNLPSSLGYFSFSPLLGYLLKSSSAGLGNVGIYLGPSLRLGSENYFTGSSGVELFFSSREAFDIGGVFKITLEKSLGKRFSLLISGQYHQFLHNRKSEHFQFEPAVTLLSGGLHLVYHFQRL